MGISTVSFNQAKIYADKMIFTLNCENGVSTRVFDKNGKNLYNRISYYAVKTKRGDYTVITRKKEYEFPGKNIVHEIFEKIYDKAGKLLSAQKHTVKK